MLDLENISDDQNLVCKFLTDWILTTNVEKYEKSGKTIFTASKGNDFLVFIYDRQPFDDVRIILTSDDKATIIHRNVISENGAGVLYSTGLMWGERVENIYRALYYTERKETEKFHSTLL